MPGSPSPCAQPGTGVSAWACAVPHARCTSGLLWAQEAVLRSSLGPALRPWSSWEGAAVGRSDLMNTSGGSLAAWLGFSALSAAVWVPRLALRRHSRVSEARPHPPVSCALT